MNQSTSGEIFYKINGISYTFFNIIRYQILICLFVWTILSIIWCVIIISKLYYNSKRFKFQSMNRCLMEDRKWRFLVKNNKLKQTKEMLLFLLCVIEILFSFNVITFMVHGMVGSGIDHNDHTYVLQPFIHIFEDSTSTRNRLFPGVGISLVIAMIDIISLVTVCLIGSYAYYPSKCEHPIRYGFIRLGVKLSVVMLFSCVVQLVIFQRVIFVVLLVYEYIRLIRLSRRLRLLLYQRYFDARFHEYQHATIHLYYKQVCREFSIGSVIVLTSLFFQIFSITVMSLYPIILTILTNPKWFYRVYNIPVTEDYIVAYYNWYLSSFSQILVMVVCASIGIGAFIITVPYFLVTSAFFFRLARRFIRGYQMHSKDTFSSNLIGEMIDRHNSAYLRY